ncbi:hypothetical protein Nepgr_010461 [Nepenthes gracilis]|uniref:Uncharacterized protein n=1 Tax=Nepenthes gracilis TaxID=150966 RepID=A0AAD3SD70_NEPGR|nr:hypothetical protein Nepgr_010461 [Nepenthes gracilis]
MPSLVRIWARYEMRLNGNGIYFFQFDSSLNWRIVWLEALGSKRSLSSQEMQAGQVLSNPSAHLENLTFICWENSKGSLVANIRNGRGPRPVNARAMKSAEGCWLCQSRVGYGAAAGICWTTVHHLTFLGLLEGAGSCWSDRGSATTWD